MANEHIGRLHKLGLGKESVSGTPVAATDWIPHLDGNMKPVFTKARDQSAYGNIHELRDSKTVKEMTEVNLDGIFRDKFGGNFLMAAFGTTYPCLKVTKSGGSGTFVVGETVTGGTSAATGVIRRMDSTTVFYISITSGTFQAAETITGGTSAATGAIAFDSALRSHVFSVLNSNNHPAYTLWGKDDVSTMKSAYCMLESLELEMTVDGFLTFKTVWKGKKRASDTGTPAYTVENEFLAKHATIKFAADLASLGAASAVDISRMKLTFVKNLKDFQKFGSVDIASIHNQQMSVAGDLEALFNSTTLHDYVVNSNKKAMRIELTNTDVTIGSAGNPALRIDLAQVSFSDWTRDGGNNDLQMQTLGLEAEYSVGDSEAASAILNNARTTTY